MKYLIKTLKFVLVIIAIAIFAVIIWSVWFVATFHGDTYGKAEAYVIDIGTYEKVKYTTSSDIVDLLYEFQTLHHPEKETRR